MPSNSDSDWAPISQNAPAAQQGNESDWQPIGSTTTTTLPPAKATPNAPILDQAKVLGNAFGQIKTAASSAFNQGVQGVDEISKGESPLAGLESGLKVGGAIANTAFSPLAPVMKPIQDAIGAGVNAVTNLPSVQKAALALPNLPYEKLGEDAGNVGSIAGAITGAKGADIGPNPSEAATSLTKANDALGSALSPFKSKTELQSSATANINKAISNTGKASAGGILAKDTARLTGFENLYKLTNGKTFTRADGSAFTFDPTNISDPRDLLTAFNQTKQTIWDQVQSRLQRGQNVPINYGTAESALKDVLANSASNNLKSFAIKRLDELQTLKSQGVQGAQRYLQEELNPRIGAALQGAKDAPQLKLDVQLAGKINDALDNGLSQLKGSNIAPLKDMYSSLKSIEPGLVTTYQKMARASGTGGLPGYINDFGNLSLIEAAASHNPAFFIVKGLGTKLISKVLESQRNPIDHIQSAFKSISNYTKPQDIPTEPTLALPPGNPNAASQINSGPAIPLPAQSSTDLRTTFPQTNDTITPNEQSSSVGNPPTQRSADFISAIKSKLPPMDQRGFIANPLKARIHPEDLSTMRDFNDYMSGAYKPSDKASLQLETDAGRIAQKYGISDTTNQRRLAMAFGRILDAKQFAKKLPPR